MPDRPVAPVAARRPVHTTVFDQERVDPYYWMRFRDDPAVIAHLKAENTYTAGVLSHTEALQQALFREMVGHVAETDETAPAPDHGYWYSWRHEAGKQYRVYTRRQAIDGVEHVLLDENLLAEGQPYFRMGVFRVSPDQRLLAYSVDFNGGERFDLFVKDLASGANVDGPIPNTGYEVEWSADSSVLLYVTSDAAWRGDKIWLHRLGDAPDRDTLIYHETDEAFWTHCSKTRSGEFFVIHNRSNTTSEIALIPAADPGAARRLVVARRTGILATLDHSGGWIYLCTNEDAVTFKVVRVPASDPSAEPELFIEADESITRDLINAFARHLVVYEREGGLQHVRVVNLDTGEQHRVAFDEPVYAIEPFGPFFNQDFQADRVRFGYSSLVTPPRVLDYDMTRRVSRIRKVLDVPGYHAEHYRSERVFAPASDGALVPISLVYRADTPRDGTAPLFLYGYGSYGATLDPAFEARRLPLLDRGFVYAVAHVRGGGEMGRAWYEQGKLLSKCNTFTDFIACAEFLLREGYASPQRVAVKGRSAGGLLMGAVTTMRPDLFRAVIAGVPFVDVVNTSLDPSLPLVVNEYEEWGDPRIREHFEYMCSYSPYDNTRPNAYPSILATAGLYDPRVQYWEPAKWVARLRDVNTGERPVLLKTEMVGGHAGPSGRYDYLKDLALEYAFVLDALDMAGGSQ